MQNRRTFLKYSSQTALGLGLMGMTACNSPEADNKKTESSDMAEKESAKELFFKLSLAQWSLHKALFAKEMDNLDFPAKAKELGFAGVEWVAHFFTDKASDAAYLAQMSQRSKDAGVENLLIMIDGKGDLSITDEAERLKAVENHFEWVNAAKTLGCHSIRVNLFGVNEPKAWHDASVDSLGRLAEYAQKENINVLVENHGWLSSDSSKLVEVMKEVNMPNVGTLPDFGNFCTKRDSEERWGGNCVEEYDRYLGTQQMMPFAKAVSAKSYDFDEKGEETKIDFMRMLKIVKSFDYTGYIGVEYEGEVKPEIEGIIATRDLLIKHGMSL